MPNEDAIDIPAGWPTACILTHDPRRWAQPAVSGQRGERGGAGAVGRGACQCGRTTATTGNVLPNATTC